MCSAPRLFLDDDTKIPVVTVEDIIGLKVQAIANDSTRASSDWNDIETLLASARDQLQILDWNLIEDYLQLFRFGDRFSALRSLYGSPE